MTSLPPFCFIMRLFIHYIFYIIPIFLAIFLPCFITVFLFILPLSAYIITKPVVINPPIITPLINFIKFTSLSVSGAAVAANISFFVAAALNIWYIIPVGRSRRADVKAPQSQTACGGVYEDNAYRPRR